MPGDHWPHPQFAHPAFAPIRPLLAGWDDFPSHSQLSHPTTAWTQSGLPVQFVDQDSLTRYYEAEIYELGRVATREQNWHDLFNALIWRTWPQTKSALNALHYRQLNAQGPRGPIRDAATLFDECGLVIAYSDPAHLEAMIAHRWHDLFCNNAAAWGQSIQPLCFGHATLEALLNPFIGLTAKCWTIAVDPAWFTLDLATRITQLDTRIAQAIHADELQKPKQLPPLPYLGIPRWWPQQDEDFYANTHYFRP